MSRKQLVLILALAPVLLAVSVACGGSSKKKDSGSDLNQTPASQATSAPRATSSPSSQNSGGSSEVSKVIDAFTKVKSYRAKMTIEASGQTQQGNFEYVAPDRIHMTITVPGSGTIELISIGSDSYTKIGNSWTKTPGAGFGAGFDPKQIQSGVNDLGAAGATKSGSETVEGKKCDIWTTKSGGSDVQYCISSDNLPLRVISQTSGTKVTIIFTDYNANIDIKAPI